MPLRLVSSFLLRAPLLPAGGAADLLAHPLGAEAVALASPDLAAALFRGRGGRLAPAVARALERYRRRAAFRPTPHGLLAGVAVGRLGAATRLLAGSGGTRAHVVPSWGRLAAAGRTLLEDPAVRPAVRLRVAPSLLAAEAQPDLWWLALPAASAGRSAGEDAPVEVREAALDPALAAVLDAAEQWSGWPQLRAVAAAAHEGGDDGGGLDEQELDEYLLMLVDQGLLHHDLQPPLVGPPPLAWMERRLHELAAAVPLPVVEAARELLAGVLGAAGSTTPAQLARELEALPGEARPAVQATLVHEGSATLSRAVVERAAALAPLLFRLQEALAPPAAERELAPELAERLEGIAETFGAGSFDLSALATGDHGATLAIVDEELPAPRSPEPALLAHLVALLSVAAHEGRPEITLDPAALDELLPARDPPPSFELVLTPHEPPPGRGRRGRAGAGWLLGLHAPAGASWGRFAEPLGAPMVAALDELAAAERAARPAEPAADVAFAASAELADLCAHPVVRGHLLALLSWDDPRAIGGGPIVLRPADLQLVIDPSAPEPLAFRARREAAEVPAVRPSPLHRVRSTTVPAGIFRLLAGWTFMRQHAAWAFSWGALGALPRLPRVVLGGFVVSPASWRIPPAAELARGGLRRWRQAASVPRRVQVGSGDELLLVDLDARDAAGDLARHEGERAHEVWPPLEAGRRRVEAVVAVVHEPDATTTAAAEPTSGEVPPPARMPPPPQWTTYKLFGAEERQEQVLLAGVAPLVRAGRAAGELDAWFFLRYVDGPGRRDHLRVRVRAPHELAAAEFARRLREVTSVLLDTGDLVALETADYFPETARYGGARTLAVVERLFELDSELVIRLLENVEEASEPPPADRLELLVRSWDALAHGLGLDLGARRALAARRRAAHGPWLPPERRPELDQGFRQRQRRLAGALGGGARDGDLFSAALDAHATMVRAVTAELSPPAITELLAVLPSVLHLSAVRLVGARQADEAAAYVFWHRALEGLAARGR